MHNIYANWHNNINKLQTRLAQSEVGAANITDLDPKNSDNKPLKHYFPKL